MEVLVKSLTYYIGLLHDSHLQMSVFKILSIEDELTLCIILRQNKMHHLIYSLPNR